jgi:lipopolysaccharide transport system ATP-binding protein
MVVRLGFAVATALRPDILITDEVLAVGDESFQKKCIAWMENYLASGGTLLLCSHSMFHVQKLCRAALWLKDGRVARYGPASEVCQSYVAYHEEKSVAAKRPIAPSQATAAGFYAIQRLSLEPAERISSNGTLTVRGGCIRPTIAAGGDDRARARGRHLASSASGSDMDGVRPVRVKEKHYAFTLRFPRLPLLPGKYCLRAHALDPEGVRLFDNVEHPFVVEGTARELGLVRLDHAWDTSAAQVRPRATVGPDTSDEVK